MRRIVAMGPALVVLLAALALVLAIPYASRVVSMERTRANVRAARQALDENDILWRIDEATRSIAQLVEPTVVHIEVRGRASGAGWGLSSGSGWVYDERGHVVTNWHVIVGGRAFAVHFSDGRVTGAELVGSDPFTDIAVLRVDPGVGLVALTRATGRRVSQGERVFAFGSPFQYKFSMSQGIISGLGRTARGALGEFSLTNYLQTDAAVNPGNSGGPLVDSQGRLVGMSVAIATAGAQGGVSSEGQSAGVGFAIPLGTIEARVPRLIEGAPPIPAFMGVQFRNRTEFVDIPAYRGRGLRIDVVVPGGAAEAAGMVAGDVVVSIDNEAIETESTFRTIIGVKRPGDVLKVRVLRGESLAELSVQLRDAPPGFRASQLSRTLVELTGVILIDSSVGVLIDRVFPGGPGARAMLLPGMRLVRVGDRRVESVEEALNALAAAGLFAGRAVDVHVVDVDADEGDSARRITLDPKARGGGE